MKITLRPQSCTAHCYREPLSPALHLEMVQIPGGSFQRGSPEDEPERYGDEGPQRLVTVPSFFMGRTPVTQSQWRSVATQLPQSQYKLEPSPSHFQGDDHPVEQVSWHEAVEFCDRLAQKTQRPYRLPSEAEWEYACRANSPIPTPFHFGSILTPDLANYDWSQSYQDSPTKAAGSKGTTPVRQFPPNAFGLYDLHGNVWEWCADRWHSNYVEAPIDGSAWTDAESEESENVSRVLRGGSWIYGPRNCRSAYRYDFAAGTRYFGIGFRVCCSAPRTS